MVRPGHIQRSQQFQYQGNPGTTLSEREQHILRERLLERASKEIPQSIFGGPLFRVLLFFSMAVAFGAGIWRASEEEVAYEFFAAWLLELCLSAENLFAIYMIFRYFKVPAPHQELVLWWGLIGAVIMRGVSIFAGGVAILLLKELMLGYAAIVIYSGFRLVSAPSLGQVGDQDMSQNAIVKFVQYVIPVTDYYDGSKFLSHKPDGSLAATPLLVVLIAVELTDFIFAIDNVPALFGVAERGDVFIVFMATIFGLLGLRSAYTLLTLALPHMPYLQKATGLVLIFVGMRALFDYFGVNLPTGISLVAIIVVLGGSAAVSVLSADWMVDAPVVEGNDVEHVSTSLSNQYAHNFLASSEVQPNFPTPPSSFHVSPNPHYSTKLPAPHVLNSTLQSKGRTVAADLIGNVLGDPPGGSSASSLAFKMTAQD
mmetsp:Transcript_29846/g.41271  ORF Transcript_29846/g.41271 Transcript_29846/m.41271 type:complete len:427 (+) Transcript_29846:363-1643(+)|eukprot:CAMPEP_0196580494 /NCGR_PEP_ID=MMETSP1081-20130531/28820_1 /TAXON_ID=36882 /ORGANISM="Pyramimonas amylifera, Strain CCMP720" /LENGTH=426 /DNA_ID=CAMNT_0041900373 /DNA_START=353 /DNA_END=1633 /DNA_ORIENTATION=+